MTDANRSWKRIEISGAVLLAASLPGALTGLSLRSPLLMAVGIVSFFIGLWCFAVARVKA